MDKHAGNYMHFMVRSANGRPGWIAPAEMPENEGPVAGSYVLPVGDNGRLENEYQVDVCQYNGNGERTTAETLTLTSESTEKGTGSQFFLAVAGQTVVFQERHADPKDTRLRYIGHLEHPDFDSTLVEVEPVPENSLDVLLDETGMVVIGCEPWDKYDGIEQIGMPPSEGHQGPDGERPPKPLPPGQRAKEQAWDANRRGPINPIQFAHSVCDEFLRYIFSAFPLSDPQMETQIRQLLQRSSSLDIPLVKGPFISLSESFAKGDPITELADNDMLHPAMPKLIGYPTMYLHQQKVFHAVKDKQHVLVATGTGSGKTEAFLYPIVDRLLRERDQGVTSGLSAILVYPMNALANDQLDRLRSMLGGTGITFGQWVGPTPAKEAEVSIDRFDGSSREAYLAVREERLNEAQREDRAVRLLAPPEECCSEEAIRDRKPRILITNYRQLEILTTRMPDVELFSGAPLNYLVFDEAHTYSGAVGAEVACLIRRLRALAGKKPNEVTCIGTSATLADPSMPDDDNERVALRFASRFFGVEEKSVALVGEEYVDRDWPEQRYKPVFPGGNGMGRLARILAALADPENVAGIQSVVEEVTGQIFDPGEDWRVALFNHLVGNEYIFQSTQILKQPKWLDAAAWQTSQRLAMGRQDQGEDCTAELLCYLVLGAAARKGDESLLRPKVHFFIRGLDEMVVALNGTPSDVMPNLHLSLADAKESEGGGRHDDSFFRVLTCRSCGQHFFENHYQDLGITLASKRIRGFENGNAVTDDEGKENAVWSTAPDELDGRLVMTNRLLEEADDNGTRRSARWPSVYICRHCGAMHRSEGKSCLADGCRHAEDLLPLMAFGSRLSSCPSCSSPAMNIGGRHIEPAKKIRAVTVADVHILSQAMINSAPEGHKKLIVFADSRQDAAFQAGWMQDHARRIRLRHMMFEVFAESDEPIAIDAITDGLMERFRKDNNLIESLLPELTGEEAPVFFGHKKWVAVHRSLRYMVLREFSTGIRRKDCLESLGLARVCYEGVDAENPKIEEWANAVGITSEQAVDAISLILDTWRRSRILFVPDDPVYSQYHRKDNPYVQLGLLPLGDFRPGGMDKRSSSLDKYSRGVISDKGQASVQVLMKRLVADPENTDIDGLIEQLWDLMKDDLGVITKTSILSTRDRELARVFQVNHSKLFVETIWFKERCTTCQRVMTRRFPNSICTRYRCKGVTITEDADPENYDVWLMGKPFTMVSAEEHTAQVPGDVRAFIEQDFKSKNGKTNCLVATPTLEMGVNIGALDMALMRNVPPLASNYWQRAGRAGREERMAVVVTYCRRSLHDRYFFDDPLRILDGLIEAPSFNLKNPLMVAKHIRSAVLSILLLRSRRDDDEQSERIRMVLKHLFPPFVRDYLVDADSHFRNEPISTSALKNLLLEMPDLLIQLVDLFAMHWPVEAAELATEEFVKRTIEQTADELTIVVTRLHNRMTWARNTRKQLHKKKDDGIIDQEEEQLLWRCNDYIRSIVKRDAKTYTLSLLGVEGFLPGYGVNDGGVIASARRGFAKGIGSRAFDLNRGNIVALREFVPGNRLYANRGSFYVSRYHLGTEDASRIRTLYVNAEKGYVAEKNADTTYGQTDGLTIDTLPLTDSDLSLASRITDEETLRFAMPVTVVGRMRRINKGGKGIKIAEQELSLLRGQGIELVNLGEAGRVSRGELGYWICSVCGATKSPYAVDTELGHFLKLHEESCGKAPELLALTVKADVDCIQFHKLQNDTDAVNLGEALCAGATRVLDMGQGDLGSLVLQRPDETVDLLLYDPMPGGSGLLDQMLSRWKEIIDATKLLLNECPQQCETACYTCLKSFRNQFNHPRLNRHRALELVVELHGEPDFYRTIEPLFEESAGSINTEPPTNKGEARLIRLLRDFHFPEGECQADIATSAGLNTQPDWIHEASKVAVYLDGMSRNLHGDPKTAQRDQLIRQMLELDGYKVIVVQSKDLNDPQAVRVHLKNIANAISRNDLAEMIEKAPLPEVSAQATDSQSESPPLPEHSSDLLEFCDDRCRGFLRAWIEAGLMEPEVGFGLTDEEGVVVAECELAWPESKVAAIFECDGETDFTSRGWKVYNAADLENSFEELKKTIGGAK